MKSEHEIYYQDAWEQLTNQCPDPWYLDTCNEREVIVKDNTGGTVYYEDLGSIPSEWPSSRAEKEILKAHALGRFLVAYSAFTYANRMAGSSKIKDWPI
jgi:hypothetical protein